MDTLKNTYNQNKFEIKLVYFAILIVLVFLIFAFTIGILSNKEEGYRGSALGSSILSPLTRIAPVSRGVTGGSTLRRLGQEFSQPGQGKYGIAHRDEVLELVKPSERLVSLRGSPDIWEIGSILSKYRNNEMHPGEGKINKGKEYMTPNSGLSVLRDAQLNADRAALYS